MSDVDTTAEPEAPAPDETVVPPDGTEAEVTGDGTGEAAPPIDEPAPEAAPVEEPAPAPEGEPAPPAEPETAPEAPVEAPPVDAPSSNPVTDPPPPDPDAAAAAALGDLDAIGHTGEDGLFVLDGTEPAAVELVAPAPTTPYQRPVAPPSAVLQSPRASQAVKRLNPYELADDEAGVTAWPPHANPAPAQAEAFGVATPDAEPESDGDDAA